MKKILSLLAVLMLTVSIYAQKTLANDPAHSRIQFATTHLTINDITGNFDKASLTIHANEQDFTKSHLLFEVDPTSINTHVEARDNHLKSADFFDVATYPKMVFSSTSIKKTKKNYYQVNGNLLMHGVTKPVKITLIYRGSTVNPMSKKTTYGYQVLATLKRSDFGIGAKFPEAIISDLVRIKGDFELTEQ
ncbi:YceI family protein [uncultured Chryseobacterium sp.]|uniref:YceI family protein n=1 Tax=uncultured Chryseobacterium sp. TaxID=259322 RepID=UPI00263970BF|nr:YceI family protein [uncultured Chryseobacterium sp.]